MVVLDYSVWALANGAAILVIKQIEGETSKSQKPGNDGEEERDNRWNRKLLMGANQRSKNPVSATV